MPTDASILPRKKPSIFWWIGAAILGLLLAFIFQLFGPSPRIIVSPQTTFITEPLLPSGLPDFERYILDRSRQGVTPENNAAALVWPALWPGELSPNEYAVVAAELELDAVPSGKQAIVPVYKRIKAWVRSRPRDDSEENPAPEIDRTTDQIFEYVDSHPWTTAQYPWLGKWVEQNREPLDRLVEASHRSRCYFPSPTLIDNRYQGLMLVMIPGDQGSREAGRSLSVRAMCSLGEGRVDAAWRDLLAMHRLGRLVAQGPHLVDQLIGIAIDGMACQGTAALLHEGHLSVEHARQIMADSMTLENFVNVAESLDQEDRVSFVDLVIQLSQQAFDSDTLRTYGLSNQLRYFQHVRVDWNLVLKKGNQYVDRYSAAAQLKIFGQRKQAISQIDREIGQLRTSTRPQSMIAAAMDTSARSDLIASQLIAEYLPPVNAVVSAQDRANTKLDLLRIAAALALFRAEHGDYPQKLDELVPATIDKLPADLFYAKPYIYRRIGEGYLLYTTGPNGIDDGGSSEQEGVFEGSVLRYLDGVAPDRHSKIPPGADDISIRVPQPPAKPPQALPAQ